MLPTKQLLVNVGCGTTFHTAWDNLDLVPAAPSVRQVNILQGLPYQNETVDACYSSHVLEHLRPAEAEKFIAEQFRVLKKGGVIRVAVPDLEAICKNYLNHLNALTSGIESDRFYYDYTLLEMYDQVTREYSGGELYRFIQNLPELDDRRQAFLRSRLHRGTFDKPNRNAARATRLSMSRRISNKAKRTRHRLAEIAVKLLLGDSALTSLRRGLFRDSGEVHHVMYDRYGLGDLLSRRGFSQVSCCEAGQSKIPGFASFSLELVDAAPLKPDSLYVEAIKP